MWKQGATHFTAPWKQRGDDQERTQAGKFPSFLPFILPGPLAYGIECPIHRLGLSFYLIIPGNTPTDTSSSILY